MERSLVPSSLFKYGKVTSSLFKYGKVTSSLFKYGKVTSSLFKYGKVSLVNYFEMNKGRGHRGAEVGVSSKQIEFIEE
jgi:hypothetical protein